jgi:hypothetical protein
MPHPSISSIIEEFEKKSDVKNFKVGEYHRLIGEHLFCGEWYPETSYELDGDKIIDWLRSSLTSYTEGLVKELEGMNGAEGLPADVQRGYKLAKYDAVNLIKNR